MRLEELTWPLCSPSEIAPASPKNRTRSSTRTAPPIHERGFFTIDDGKALLRNLIGRGIVPESENERLTAELDASGLPSDPQSTSDKLIRFAVAKSSFYIETSREEMFAMNVKQGSITEDMLPEIRERIAALSNEERVADGVEFFMQFDLDTPEAEAEVRRVVIPELADEILKGAREAQTFPSDIFGMIL